MRKSSGFLLALAAYQTRRIKLGIKATVKGWLAARWYLKDLDMLLSQAIDPGVVADVELFPQLQDQTSTTGFDAHYVQQGPWAFRHVLEMAPTQHIDVGSFLGYLPFFSAVVPTTFIDIRPSGLVAPGLTEKEGSVLQLPFGDQTVSSLSCMHVVEHIGLGRYGDPVDVNGTALACAELARVMSPGGYLYLTTPIGRPRICFNAHRVHSVEQIVSYCSQLRLDRFDAVLDDGTWVNECDAARVQNADYALGLFRFTRV